MSRKSVFLTTIPIASHCPTGCICDKYNRLGGRNVALHCQTVQISDERLAGKNCIATKCKDKPEAQFGRLTAGAYNPRRGYESSRFRRPPLRKSALLDTCLFQARTSSKNYLPPFQIWHQLSITPLQFLLAPSNV